MSASMLTAALTADHLIAVGRGRLLRDVSMSAFLAEHARVLVRSPQAGALHGALLGRTSR